MDERNLVSVANSLSASSLPEGTTATGTFEDCSKYAAVCITIRTTTRGCVGLLGVDFSRDGIASAVTTTSEITDGHVDKLFTTPVLDKYFRVWFIACAVTDTRTIPIANDFSLLNIETRLVDVRPPSYDFVVGQEVVRVSGISTQTDATRIVGQSLGASGSGQSDSLTSYPLTPFVADVQVVNSSGAANDEGGTGARTFFVWGLDESCNRVYWKGGFLTSSTDNGRGAGVSVRPTSKLFTRINGFQILTYGSGGAPASGSSLQLQMYTDSNGYGILWRPLATLSSDAYFKYDACVYTVPAGLTASVVEAIVSTSSATATSIAICVVRNGQRQARRVVQNVSNRQQGSFKFAPGQITAFAGDTVFAETTSTGTQTVSVELVLVLQMSWRDITPPSSTPTAPTFVNPSKQAWFDAANTSLIATSGGLVSQWSDRSGNTRSATQSTAGNKPALVSSAYNSFSCVRFDGSNDFLGYNGAWAAGGSYYVAAVVARNTGSDNQYWLGASDAGGGTNHSLVLGWPTSTTYTHSQVSNDVNFSMAAFVSRTAELYGTRYVQNSMRTTWKTGTELTGSETGSLSDLSGCANAAIGQFNSQFFNGDVCEVICMSSPSTQLIELVEGYLAFKWGITITEPLHSFVSVPPLPPVTTLQLWLDAADSLTLQTDDFGLVMRWADKSGNNRHAVQSEMAYRPVAESSFSASKSSVRFSASQGLNFDGSFLASQSNWTIFAVAQRRATGTANILTADNSAGVFLYWYNSTLRFRKTGSGGLTGYINPYSAAKPTILCITHSSTAGTALYIDGYRIAYDAADTTNLSTNYGSILASATDGNVAELAVFTETFVDSDRQYTEGALAEKWGLRKSLIYGHPFSTATLTATNTSTAQSFTYNTPVSMTAISISGTTTVTAKITLSDASAGSLNTGTSGGVTSAFSGGVWTATGAVANVNALLAALTFTPTSAYITPFSFYVAVYDSDSAVWGTKTMAYVNVPPSATNLSTAQTYYGATSITPIVITDVDSTTVTATLTLSSSGVGSINTGTSGSVTSTFSAGVWSASGAKASVNALLAALTFTPSGTSTFTITTNVSDGTDSVSGSKTMTYDAPPSATNLSTAQTYSGTTALTAIVITDDSASVTATLTLSTTAAGSLSTGTYSGTSSSFDSGTGVWSATGSVANVNYLLAHTNYVPAGGYTSAFAIATYVTDGSASVSGSKAMTAAGANQPPYSPYLNFTARNVNNDGTWPASGTSITVWKDTMNNVVPTWTTGTATIVYGQQGSNPVLSVSGFRNKVSAAVANQFVNSFTQFIRMSWTYVDGVGSWGCVQQDNTSTWYMHYAAFSWYGSFYIDHGHALLDYASGGGRMMSGTVVPLSGFHNVCFRYNSSTKKGDIFLDGTNVKSGTFTGSGSNVTPPTGYTAQFGDDSTSYKCQLICYTTALSDSEVAAVFSYLTSEWS